MSENRVPTGREAMTQRGREAIRLISIKESPNKNKKFRATFSDGKSVDFGMAGASDFTLSGDEKAKQNYLARHKPRENWNDPQTAGALSRWILWNKSTLQASLKDFIKRFDL